MENLYEEIDIRHKGALDKTEEILKKELNVFYKLWSREKTYNYLGLTLPSDMKQSYEESFNDYIERRYRGGCMHNLVIANLLRKNKLSPSYNYYEELYEAEEFYGIKIDSQPNPKKSPKSQ